MRIEFNYDLEDIREVAIPETQVADPGKFKRKRIIGLVTWILLASLIVPQIFLYRLIWRGPDPENPPQDLLVEILPAAIPASFVVLIYLIAIWKGWRKSRFRATPGQPTASKNNAVARTLRILVSIAIGIGAYTLVRYANSVIWHPSRTQLILVRLASWAVVIGLTVILGKLQRRWGPRQVWFTQPSWRRPKVIEMDAQGFCLSDPLMRATLTWAGFARARETQNLLVLVTQDGLNYLIPKRAFADPVDVDHCRALLQNVLPQTSFLVRPVGFAVLPKPVIPLPELASEHTETDPLDAIQSHRDDPRGT